MEVSAFSECFLCFIQFANITEDQFTIKPEFAHISRNTSHQGNTSTALTIPYALPEHSGVYLINIYVDDGNGTIMYGHNMSVVIRGKYISYSKYKYTHLQDYRTVYRINLDLLKKVR